MNPLEKFHEINCLIFDVDGVFTDGRVLVTESGAHLRQFHTRDGLAIKLAARAGLKCIAISGGQSEGVRIRLGNLGFEQVVLGVDDKMEVYEHLVESLQLDEGAILYMGDDLPDYPVMRRVGLPVCPRNAAPEVLELAQFVSSRDGGDGCVREVVEKLLRIQDKWPTHPSAGAAMPPSA